MGRNAWLRVQLGLTNVHDLREKLNVHLLAMNALFNEMSLSLLGRVEERLGELDDNMDLILRLLIESTQAERAGHKEPTVLSAHESPDGPEWDRMKMELILAGVPKNDIDTNRDKITEILGWVVNDNPQLENLEEVDVDDSISQRGAETSLTQLTTIPDARVHQAVQSDYPMTKSAVDHDIARGKLNVNIFSILIVDGDLGRTHRCCHKVWYKGR